MVLGAVATTLLALRVLTEPHCASRPAPDVPIEPRLVLKGATLKPFALGNEAGARALLWARLAVDASYEPLPQQGLSWEYGQLDAVTELDRNFAIAYPFGSAFLSTFRRDEEGAERILRKWVRYEPQSWRSHAWLGYHLYFERNRAEEAAPYLLRASTMPGAPAWLAAMGARVLSESERLPQQLRRLVDLYPRIPEGLPRERLSARIRAVRLRYETERLERGIEAYRQKHRQWPGTLAELQGYLEAPSRAVASLDDVGDDNPVVRRELAQLLSEQFRFQYDRKTGIVRADVGSDIERVGVYPNRHEPTPEDEDL